MQKTLEAINTSALVDRIRDTRRRQVVLRKPVIQHEDGKATVLTLSSGKAPLGTVRAKTREEAKRVTTSNQVTLKIGWDTNRNEKVVAVFE